MPTEEDVKRQITQLGPAQTSLYSTRKEVNYLPGILSTGEEVLAISSGIMAGKGRWDTRWNSWLLVCTTKRILFVNKGMLYGLEQRETPLEKINSIEQTTGIFFGKIKIWDGASQMEIRNVPKGTVKPFVAAVNKACEDYGKHRTPGEQPTRPSPTDDIEALERLAALLDKGVLSQEEFEARKAKLLGR